MVLPPHKLNTVKGWVIVHKTLSPEECCHPPDEKEQKLLDDMNKGCGEANENMNGSWRIHNKGKTKPKLKSLVRSSVKASVVSSALQKGLVEPIKIYGNTIYSVRIVRGE